MAAYLSCNIYCLLLFFLLPPFSLSVPSLISSLFLPPSSHFPFASSRVSIALTFTTLFLDGEGKLFKLQPDQLGCCTVRQPVFVGPRENGVTVIRTQWRRTWRGRERLANGSGTGKQRRRKTKTHTHKLTHSALFRFTSERERSIRRRAAKGGFVCPLPLAPCVCLNFSRRG